MSTAEEKLTQAEQDGYEFMKAVEVLLEIPASGLYTPTESLARIRAKVDSLRSQLKERDAQLAEANEKLAKLTEPTARLQPDDLDTLIMLFESIKNEKPVHIKLCRVNFEAWLETLIPVRAQRDKQAARITELEDQLAEALQECWKSKADTHEARSQLSEAQATIAKMREALEAVHNNNTTVGLDYIQSYLKCQQIARTALQPPSAGPEPTAGEKVDEFRAVCKAIVNDDPSFFEPAERKERWFLHVNDHAEYGVLRLDIATGKVWRSRPDDEDYETGWTPDMLLNGDDFFETDQSGTPLAQPAVSEPAPASGGPTKYRAPLMAAWQINAINPELQAPPPADAQKLLDEIGVRAKMIDNPSVTPNGSARDWANEIVEAVSKLRAAIAAQQGEIERLKGTK